MQKRIRKITSLLLSLTILLSLFLGVTANAAPAPLNGYSETTEMDNGELMEGYFGKEVKDLTRPSYRMRLFSVNRRVFPNGYEKEERVYNYLVPIIESIAAGERDDSMIEIPVWVILGGEEGKTEYTKKELGVTTNSEAGKAVRFDYELVWHTLLRNAPYDLYWHDKTKGISMSSVRYGCTDTDVIYSGCPSIGMMVAADYAPGNAVKGTKVDVSKTGAVKKASEEAARVINTAKGKSDYEKLDFYREYICDEVSYNYDAIKSDYNHDYFNPWQLIWVFDKDPDTKVVCEGYSKAFKHLCDNTSFDSGNIRCELAEGGIPRSVTSSLRTAPHMWNIVRMDDGKTYFADITNCDDDKVPNRTYFLVGTEKDSNGFYRFTKQFKDGNLTYTKKLNFKYFDDFRDYYKKLGEENFLEISDSDYVPEKEPEIKKYIVDFDLNGIGTGKPEKQVVAEGGKIEKPEDPKSETHIFEGWFRDKETKEEYDFSKEVKEDTTLFAKWKEKIKYTLEVVKGKITGSTDKEDAKPGETVSIKANRPEEGYEFHKWVVREGDVVLKDETAEETTFKMPEGNVRVEATYRKLPPKEYKVTVKNGSSDKAAYKAGETVTIKAGSPEKGYEFDKWTVKEGKAELKNSASKETTFRMPEGNVTVEATFRKLPPKEYTVTVTDGYSDKKSYKAGEIVTVKADSKKDKDFAGWKVTEGKIVLKDEGKEETTFKMPESNVSLKATYKYSVKQEEEKPAEPENPVNPGKGIAGIVERLLDNAVKGLERIVKRTLSLLERIIIFIGNLFK